MKNYLKKQLSIILSMALLLSFCAGTIQAKASGTPEVAISNVTSTTADCNWSALVYSYLADNKMITGFRVSVNVPNSTDDLLMAENTTATTVHLYNLQPDSYYQVIIEPYFYYIDSVDKDINTGYEWVDFTTAAGYVPEATTQAAQTQTSVTQTPATQVPTVTAPAAPKVTKVVMSDTTVAVYANTVTAEGYEYRICNKKTGKVVKQETSSYTANTFYSVAANKTYYAQVRSYVYDSNYNKVYSGWSAKKYFIAQPTISESKSKVNNSSISIKWNKVQGAKNYTIYAKKSSSSKWSKVKTTSKTSYTITKCAGKNINVSSSDYHVRVIANTKIKGKTYKSSNNKYLRAYTY